MTRFGRKIGQITVDRTQGSIGNLSSRPEAGSRRPRSAASGRNSRIFLRRRRKITPSWYAARSRRAITGFGRKIDAWSAATVRRCANPARRDPFFGGTALVGDEGKRGSPAPTLSRGGLDD
jgi:hypothetical protein